MKRKIAILISASFLFVGCFGGSNSSSNNTFTLPDKFTPNNGRMLAAATCFQCHGTDGVSKTKWDSIAGEDAEEFYESDHPIMSAQTGGYSKEEVDVMFSYLSGLKKYEYKHYYKEDEDKEDDD